MRLSNLPLYLVDSYDDPALGDRDRLAAVYGDLAPRFESPALWFDFWRARIEERR